MYGRVIAGSIAACGVVAAIFSAVALSTQPSQQRSSAFFDAAGTLTFTEPFDTTALRDPVTTANWNTAASQLELVKGPAELRQFDLATDGSGFVGPTAFYSEFVVRPSIAIPQVGSNPNLPIIAFLCEGSGAVDAVCVTRWDGAAFVQMDGTPGFDIVSDDPTLQVFSASLAVSPVSGNPCVAYSQYDGTFVEEIELTCYTGAGWGGPYGGTGVSDVLSFTAEADFQPYIDIGPDGLPAVAWAWNGGTGTDILFVKDDGFGSYNGLFGFGPDFVTSIPNDESYPSVKIASDNNPHILYSDDTDGEIFYTQFSGASYVGLDGVTAGPSNVSSSLTISAFPSLALNDADQPAMTWTELVSGTSRPLHYSTWNGSALVGADGSAGSEIISSGDANAEASIDFDSGGNPAACWNLTDIDGGTPGEVVCSRFNGTDWVLPTDMTTTGAYNVSATPATFNFSVSAAFDSLDELYLIFDEEDGDGYRDIKHGVFVSDLVNGQATSTTIDATADSIVAATVEAVQTLNGGTVDWELSNDGGATFVAATLGSPVTFTTPDSDLRWRAIATRSATDARVGPTVDELTITYTTQEAQTPGTPQAGSTVTRVAGDDPTAQSIQVSRARFADRAALGVAISRDDVVVDALVGSSLSTALDAPILLNPTGQLSPDVLGEIGRVIRTDSDPIFILGREQAISTSVEDELRAAGYSNIVRLGDQDRNGTAAKIADYIVDSGKASTTVVLAENDRFADVFSASAAAANDADGTVEPIIITDRATPVLNSFARSFLTGYPQATAVEVVGGPEAVDASMEQTLDADFGNLSTITRTFGADRFATSRASAEAHYQNPTAVVVASGQRKDLPGALSVTAPTIGGQAFFFAALLGGTLAADQAAPLLLTESATLTPTVVEYLTANAASIAAATIVGSTSQVTEAVQLHIQSLI